MRRSMRLLMVLPAALLALALVLAGAGAQLAAPAAVPHSTPAQPEVGLEDEALLFSPQADSLAAQWRSMGVDYVRIQAYWNALSPATKSRTIPAGFDPSNPNSPGYNWGPLDAAIAAVRNNGMHVMLTLNQSNPRWASTQPSKTQASWMPNPTRFAQFVTAVGKRYGQQVNRYLMLSEPNQLPFLAPQFTCRGYTAI